MAQAAGPRALPALAEREKAGNLNLARGSNGSPFPITAPATLLSSGFFRAVVADDRGQGRLARPLYLGHSFGPEAAMSSIHHASGRGKAHPRNFLAGCRGRLPCNACLSALQRDDRDRAHNGPWQPACCRHHVRRRFVKRSGSEVSSTTNVKPANATGPVTGAKGVGFSCTGNGRHANLRVRSRCQWCKTFRPWAPPHPVSGRSRSPPAVRATAPSRGAGG